jgi:hypothetical protein
MKRVLNQAQADTIEAHDNRNQDIIRLVYCKEQFSEDVQGEKWVQNIMCEKWNDEECARP